MTARRSATGPQERVTRHSSSERNSKADVQTNGISSRSQKVKDQERLIARPLRAAVTFASALPPIVNQVDASPVVARLVQPLHRHTLKVCAEAMLEHLAIGFVTSSIDPGDQA